MNDVDSWYDNAPMESVLGTLKTEWVHNRAYRTRREARTDLLCCIEAFYDRCRLHSTLDHVSPATYEQLYHQKLAFRKE